MIMAYVNVEEEDSFNIGRIIHTNYTLINNYT